MVVRGVARFSTRCRPGWLSFPHILKNAHVTSTHWPHQHFELLSFLAHPNNALFNTSGRVIKSAQGISIQVFGLATPLVVFHILFHLLLLSFCGDYILGSWSPGLTLACVQTPPPLSKKSGKGPLSRGKGTFVTGQLIVVLICNAQDATWVVTWPKNWYYP